MPTRIHRLKILLAALLLAGMAGSAPDTSIAVEIIAHRGASHDAPENTLAAINLAWKQNVDGVEIDVHLSKDGEIVTIHDATTKRIGGRDAKVVDQTLAELRQLDMGAWKAPQFTGEKIPTLGEVLATIPEGKRLFIEVKCGPEIVDRLAEALRASKKKPAQTCIISFSHDVVARAKREIPNVRAYWILSLKQDKQTGAWLPAREEILRRAKEAGVEGLDFGDVPAIDADFIKAVKQAGFEVVTWTVDTPAAAERLKAAGVDGITSNRPALLMQHFGRK